MKTKPLTALTYIILSSILLSQTVHLPNDFESQSAEKTLRKYDIRTSILKKASLNDLINQNSIIIIVFENNLNESRILKYKEFEIDANFSSSRAIKEIIQELKLEAGTSASMCRIIRSATIETMDPRIALELNREVSPGDIIALTGLLRSP